MGIALRLSASARKLLTLGLILAALIPATTLAAPAEATEVLGVIDPDGKFFAIVRAHGDEHRQLSQILGSGSNGETGNWIGFYGNLERGEITELPLLSWATLDNGRKTEITVRVIDSFSPVVGQAIILPPSYVPVSSQAVDQILRLLFKSGQVRTKPQGLKRVVAFYRDPAADNFILVQEPLFRENADFKSGENWSRSIEVLVAARNYEDGSVQLAKGPFEVLPNIAPSGLMHDHLLVQLAPGETLVDENVQSYRGATAVQPPVIRVLIRGLTVRERPMQRIMLGDPSIQRLIGEVFGDRAGPFFSEGQQRSSALTTGGGSCGGLFRGR